MVTIGLPTIICSLLLLAATALGQALCSPIVEKAPTWKIERWQPNTQERCLTINSQWPAAPVVVAKCTEISIDVENAIGEDLTLRSYYVLGRMAISDPCRLPWHSTKPSADL